MGTGQSHGDEQVLTFGRLRKYGTVRNVIGITVSAALHAHGKDGALIDHTAIIEGDSPTIVRIDGE